MRRMCSLAFVLVAAALAGCELDIENPNDPDAGRAFEDPAGLGQLEGGAFRTWVEARSGYQVMPLTAMADNYTASWNNAALRFYSSVGSDCPSRCGWSNSATAPEAAGGPTVEAQWYGYYTVLSSANDVLRAIDEGVCFDDDCNADNTLTSRNRALGKMLQGMALAGIALIYDQGFAVDENADLSNPAGIDFNTREELRDAALNSFEDAYAEAGQRTWSSPAEWMGVGGGRSYSNDQIRRLIRTMQAELLAMFPRNAAENGQVDWGRVANFASEGISSGAPFEWSFFIDAASSGDTNFQFEYVKTWGNSVGTMRVDTRVAALLTTNHSNPWPVPNGNPCPTSSPDRRVGDGTIGPTNNADFGTRAATPNAGTDFACSGVPIFPAARGQYHQSNLQHIRYSYFAYDGERLAGGDGTGQNPFYTRQMNDLLWAEGLIRGGGSAGQAAELINNSRVGRGGLPALTGGESTAALLEALQYEQEIEFMGQGATPFFNRRRIDGLITGTPRHMPVPAKELDVLVREVYSFGGPGLPDMSVVPGGGPGTTRIRSVREIWAGYQAQARRAARGMKN